MAKKKIIWSATIIIVLFAAGAAFFVFRMGGPDPAQFEYLKEPQIRTMADQKVLEVEAKGDPTVVGSEAFGLLFKTYFKLKGVPKGPRQPAPRARWPLSFDAPKTERIGRYAMPLPEGIDAPTGQGADESGLRAEITTWTYGEVAEILHVGPYDREEPTVDRLMRFIKDGGYTIAGEHEEEYIKGPRMFLKGDPEKYLTIIRYRVKKAQ